MKVDSNYYCQYNTSVEIMLEFVRSAIFEREPLIPSQTEIDWDLLMDKSTEQGLLAWVWDGICRSSFVGLLSRQQRINWGLSVQAVWDNYERHHAVLLKMIDECNSNNMRLLLLKGIGLSKLYPKPESRPCGDIDIFLFDDYERGNRMFAQGERFPGTKDMGFYYEGVYFENHHTLIYTDTKKRVKANDFIKKGLTEATECEEGYYILPPVSNVVYLLLHILSHMDSEYVVSLRSIIDFGMFVYKNKNQLNDNNCCVNAVQKLGLMNPFCLLLKLSEYYLRVSFDTFMKVGVPVRDFSKALLLVEKKEAKHHFNDTDSLLLRWKENIHRHNQIKWLYKYIPRSLSEHILASIRKETSTFIRIIFSIPSGVSIRDFFLKKSG